ncbi:radical SAM protein [Lentzea terrae]|uniref:radical SAM protein n=1 Tax=Lentzea terrae TaxID=2200761 RepID=UPI000DD35F62|nr:radical SAM protein [Lentzea terrae]
MQDALYVPRLLKGARGWWYLGGHKLLLLGDAAVDSGGRLRSVVEHRLNAMGVNGPAPRPAYALTVLTASACNLGCAYCFQNTAPDPTGGSRPPRIATVSLDRRTAGRILRFVSGKMAESGLDKLDVHLFGGEPLLNPAGCRDLLELAADHGLSSAHMTSNGTLLTPELAQELAALGLGSVQITFDGNQIEHDQTRVRRSGTGTFDAILSNIAAANEVTSLRWDLRVNVSQRNRNGIPELIEQIGRRVDPARCNIYFALIYDTGIGFDSTAERESELIDEVVGWTVRATELGFQVSRPKPARPCLSCGFRDGRLGAVVNADGTLYSCWESAGKPGWEIGSVDSGYLPANQVDGRWVACGYGARNADQSEITRFSDAVDARILDYLHDMGRLDSTAGQSSP